MARPTKIIIALLTALTYHIGNYSRSRRRSRKILKGKEINSKKVYGKLFGNYRGLAFDGWNLMRRDFLGGTFAKRRQLTLSTEDMDESTNIRL